MQPLDEQIQVLSDRLAALENERAALNNEIARLRSSNTPVHPPSAFSAKEKISIFMGLFKGRDDIFPKRWDNPKTGKSGYAPACHNEWVRGTPLVLTERRDHAAALAERLSKFCRHIILMTGGQSTKQQTEVRDKLKSIPDNEERVLIATGRYIGEGFDDARLDTLFLTMPVSWHGTLAQYAGRLHRLHHAKKEVIVYDYVDERIPMFAKMAEKRMKGYGRIGYVIQPKGPDISLSAG